MQMKNKITYLFLLLCLLTHQAGAVHIEITATEDIPNLSIHYLKNGKNNLIKQSALAKGEKLLLNDATLRGMFTISNSIDKPLFCYFPDDKKVTIEVSNSAVNLNNKSDLNEKLEEWCTLTTPSRLISMYFFKLEMKDIIDTEKCLLTLRSLKNSSIDFLKSCEKLSAEEQKIMHSLVKADIAMLLIFYTQCPPIAGTLKIPEWTREYVVSENSLSDDTILAYYPYASLYITRYLRFVQAGHKTLSHLTSDRIKAFYLIMKAEGYKRFTEYEKMVATHGKYFVTSEEKKMLEEVRTKLIAMKEGADGYNFAFPDTEGKIVKLSDFKGKLVYIDVWATWCTPCKQEIPHLKTLEERMHGKDVVFISISTDKDDVRWCNFVKSQQLTGIQLIDKTGELAKQYNFNGIPFFILLDKEGKVIQTNAPRPSNPSTVVLLNKYLN